MSRPPGGRDADAPERSLDAWLDEPVPPPGEGLRRVVLDEVHRTRQRGAWRATLDSGGAWWVNPRAAGAVAALAAVLVLAIGVTTLGLPGPASSGPPAASTSPTFSPARAISLPGAAAALAADGDDAIVALRNGSIISVAIDGSVITLGDLVVEPCGVPLATTAAVYIAGCDARIHRVDRRSGAITAYAGAGRQLATGPGNGIWSLDATRRSAVLVDGATGTRLQEVALNAFATAAVEGFGRIWIIGEGNARLTIIDTASGAILAVVDLEHEPTFGVAGPDAFYALSAGSAIIDAVDPVTQRADAGAAGLPVLPTSVALGRTGIWVGGAGEVRLVDPATGALLVTLSTPGTAWVAGSGGATWMTATGDPTLFLLER